MVDSKKKAVEIKTNKRLFNLDEKCKIIESLKTEKIVDIAAFYGVNKSTIVTIKKDQVSLSERIKTRYKPTFYINVQEKRCKYERNEKIAKSLDRRLSTKKNST